MADNNLRMWSMFMRTSHVFCDNQLLMGTENAQAPCSGPARISCKVRFVNKAGCPVDIYWITRKGQSSLYQILPPDQSVVVNTYAGHLWHFCDVQGSYVEWLQVAQSYIYNVKERSVNGTPVEQEIIISLPLYSLQDWSKRFVVRRVKTADFQHLHLPIIMKECLEKFVSQPHHLSDDLQAVDSASLLRKRRDQIAQSFAHLVRATLVQRDLSQDSCLGLQHLNRLQEMREMYDWFGSLQESTNDGQQSSWGGAEHGNLDFGDFRTAYCTIQDAILDARYAAMNDNTTDSESESEDDNDGSENNPSNDAAAGTGTG